MDKPSNECTDRRPKCARGVGKVKLLQCELQYYIICMYVCKIITIKIYYYNITTCGDYHKYVHTYVQYIFKH